MNRSNQAGAPVESITMRAVILDAQGNVKQDLGIVGYWHRNPLRRWLYAIRKWRNK